MATRNTRIEEDTIDVNSLKSFTIPKKKKSRRDLFESVDLNSREFLYDLLPIIDKHLRDKDGKKNFRFTKAQLVHNDELLNTYLERRKEMRRNGYTDKDVQDTFAFLYSDSDVQIRQMCEGGLKVGNVSTSVLGNPEMAVCLCKHPDLSRPVPFGKNKEGSLVVFKFMKGKVKLMVENRGGVPLDPTPNYDCHVSKQLNMIDNNTPHQTAYESTQYYIYEYGDFDLSDRPRQIYPYAVLHFQFVGESKAPLKSILSKPLSTPKVSTARVQNFANLLSSISQSLTPNLPLRSPQPPIELKNDPRRKRKSSCLVSLDEAPLVRMRPNENDPSLKQHLQHEQYISSGDNRRETNYNLNSSQIITKKMANVGSIGTEVDCQRIVVWNGSLENKARKLCKVDLVVFGDPIKPARLGSSLNISRHCPLDHVKARYFTDLHSLPKNNETRYKNHYYCYAELRPLVDGDEMFSHLVLHLSKKSAAVIVPLGDDTVLILLANGSLTQALGLNLEGSPTKVLHCIFVSASSRKTVLLSKALGKLTVASSSPQPSPSPSKPVPSPGSVVSFTPSPSTPAPSPDSSGPSPRAPLLNADLISKTFSGQTVDASQKDHSTPMPTSIAQNRNSWSLNPSPSVFSMPSPTDNQPLQLEHDVYNDGYQKFVPVDSLVYKKNLVKAFLDQTVLQDKRNIDLARRRASVGSQSHSQQNSSKPGDGTSLGMLVGKVGSHLNNSSSSSTQMPQSPLVLPGSVSQTSAATGHPKVSSGANVCATTGLPAKSPCIISPLGQLIEPISPAGSTSSSLASPVPSSPYTSTQDTYSSIDQLQQQLHQKMSPIKDIDLQLKASPPNKVDQLQQQLYQKLSPLRPNLPPPPPPPAASYAGTSSTGSIGQMNASSAGSMSSSYQSHLTVPGSPQLSPLSEMMNAGPQPAPVCSMPQVMDIPLPPGPNPGISDGRMAPAPHPHGPGPGGPLWPGSRIADPRLKPSQFNTNIPVSQTSLLHELQSAVQQLQSPVDESQSSLQQLQSSVSQQQQQQQPPSLFQHVTQPQQSVTAEPGLLAPETQHLMSNKRSMPRTPSDPRLSRLDHVSQQISSEICLPTDNAMVTDMPCTSSLSSSGSSILQNILTMARSEPQHLTAPTSNIPSGMLSTSLLVANLEAPPRVPHLNDASDHLMANSSSTMDGSQNLVQSLSVGAMSPMDRGMALTGSSASLDHSRTTSTNIIKKTLHLAPTTAGTSSMSHISSSMVTSSHMARPVLSTTYSNSLEAGITKPCQTGRLTTEDDTMPVTSGTWQGLEVKDIPYDPAAPFIGEMDDYEPYDPCDDLDETSNQDSVSETSPQQPTFSDSDESLEDDSENSDSPQPSCKSPAPDEIDFNLSDDIINLIVRRQPLAAKAARELKQQIQLVEQLSSADNLNTDVSQTKEPSPETIPQYTAISSQAAVTENQANVQTLSSSSYESTKGQQLSSNSEQRKVCMKSLEQPRSNDSVKSTNHDRIKCADIMVQVSCDNRTKTNNTLLLESPTTEPSVNSLLPLGKVKEIPIDVLSDDVVKMPVNGHKSGAWTSIRYSKELQYYSQLYERSSNQQLLALGLDYVSVRFLGGAKVIRHQESNELSVVKDIRKTEQDSEKIQRKAMDKDEALIDSVTYVLHGMKEDNEDGTKEDEERVLLCHIVLHYLLPLGEAPDEESREVLNDSGHTQTLGSNSAGSQGMCGKMGPSAHSEHHHVYKRRIRTEQDEHEKEEIFHIYKTHRDLKDLLQCLSSKNFHSRHTRPLYTIFSGPFSKRHPHGRGHQSKKTPVNPGSIKEKSRNEEDEKVYLPSDAGHLLQCKQLANIKMPEGLSEHSHDTKGSLGVAEDKDSNGYSEATSSCVSVTMKSIHTPSDSSVIEIPMSPR